MKDEDGGVGGDRGGRTKGECRGEGQEQEDRGI